MCWLQSHTHLLLKKSPPVPAAYGDMTVKEVGLGMTPKSVSFKAVVWATAETDVAQPSLSQTLQLDTSAASAVLEASHSQELCSVWTSNWTARAGRGWTEVWLEILLFSLLAKLFNIILLLLKLLFLIWRAIKFSFILRPSTNRSCLWGRWVLVHHLY